MAMFDQPIKPSAAASATIHVPMHRVMENLVEPAPELPRSPLPIESPIGASACSGETRTRELVRSVPGRQRKLAGDTGTVC
jgi:hypothetical protein